MSAAQLEFKPLASSSAGCAYLLSGGGASAPLLIDCGLPFRTLRLLLECFDFKVSSLAGCIISHAHKDHSMAVDDMLISAVDCFASRDTWYELSFKYLSPCMKFLTPNQAETCGDWTVLPFEAVHDCPGTLGFVIGSPSGERLLYITDSCYSKFRFDGLTMIAAECNHSMAILRANSESGRIDHERFSRTARTHMSLERLLDMLAASDLSRVREIHLLHLSDTNSDEAAFKAAVERATGIPCYVAPSRFGL